MKVLHIPFCYFPDACGGTEIYVADLCQSLRVLGVDSVVAAPALQVSRHEHEGIPVFRYSVSNSLSKHQLNGDGDPDAAAQLEAIIAETEPTLVHFHSMTAGASLAAMRSVKRVGLPVLYTYHTATVTCMKGTLLRWGHELCDGQMNKSTCGACYLQHHSIPRLIAKGLVGLSHFLGRHAESLRAPLDVAWLSQKRISTAREWLSSADRVVALCEWSRKLLAGNGVEATRLRVVRHGIRDLVRAKVPTRRPEGNSMRLAFLGRVDPTKGLSVLLNAMKRVPDLPLELHVHAVIQEGSYNALAKKLREAAATDSRVRLLDPVPRSEVCDVLQSFDALVVPSLVFETGPLVVLEAFAAGIPVIGSGWGGIAEWVEHERNGLLVSEQTPEAWAAMLRRLVNERDLLPRLRAEVKPPRTMLEVAAEMQAIYQELRN